MQSTHLPRSLFGCSRISFIVAALFFGALALVGNAGAQEPPSPERPTPESPGMAKHPGMSTSLRELIQEAEQKNPQIAAWFHGWQASRNVPKQASALPETQLSVQQFSVGSLRPFAGYSNSDFAYIGFGASQDIPYPGKRQLRCGASSLIRSGGMFRAPGMWASRYRSAARVSTTVSCFLSSLDFRSFVETVRSIVLTSKLNLTHAERARVAR